MLPPGLDKFGTHDFAIAAVGKQNIRNDRANAKIFAKRIDFISKFLNLLQLH
jgi:hypothetical protein